MSIAAAPAADSESDIVQLMNPSGELVSAVKVSASTAGMLRANHMNPMMNPAVNPAMTQMNVMGVHPAMNMPNMNSYAGMNPSQYGMPQNPSYAQTSYTQTQMPMCGPSQMFGGNRPTCSMTPNTANRPGCGNPNCATCSIRYRDGPAKINRK